MYIHWLFYLFIFFLQTRDFFLETAQRPLLANDAICYSPTSLCDYRDLYATFFRCPCAVVAFWKTLPCPAPLETQRELESERRRKEIGLRPEQTEFRSSDSIDCVSSRDAASERFCLTKFEKTRLLPAGRTSSDKRPSLGSAPIPLVCV